MARRPLCLACLLLMLAMAMADLLGMPLIRGNPLPKLCSREYSKKASGDHHLRGGGTVRRK